MLRWSSDVRNMIYAMPIATIINGRWRTHILSEDHNLLTYPFSTDARYNLEAMLCDMCMQVSAESKMYEWCPEGGEGMGVPWPLLYEFFLHNLVLGK